MQLTQYLVKRVLLEIDRRAGKPPTTMIIPQIIFDVVQAELKAYVRDAGQKYEGGDGYFYLAGVRVIAASDMVIGDFTP